MSRSRELSKWTVYIIQADNGKLYTGITTDLERRLQEHQSGPKGARFFHFTKAVKVVYSEGCKDRSSASRREAQIKKMSRDEKLKLVSG